MSVRLVDAASSCAVADAHGTFLVREDASLPIYSIAKTIIASLVLRTGIDPTTSVAHWIDSDLLPGNRAITIEHLLCHTSGLTDYGALPAYHQAIQSGAPPWSDAEFAAHTLQQPLLFEPGRGWSYSNPGYWLLTQVVERESGLPLAELVRQFVSEPLGLNSLYVAEGQFAADLPWYPAGWVWHGLMVVEACDVVRFMMSDLVRPLLRTLVAVPHAQPPWRKPHYGYGLMVEPDDRYGHNGAGPGYSASSFHFPATGLTACVLMRTNTEDAAMQRVLALVDDLSG